MSKLILVSGWATPKGSLTRVVRELSKTFEVTAFLIGDLMASSSHNGHSPLSIYASHLLKIIKESKEPCLLMGWSMGGMIALETAASSSEKILGLILVSTSPSFCSRENFPYGFPQANVRALSLAIRKDPQSALTRFYRKVCYPHPTTTDREENWLKEVLEENASNLHKELDYLVNIDLRPMIHKLNIPSLVIHGKEDAIIPWQAGEWLAKNLPYTSFELSQANGHDLPMRKSTWLIQKIESFNTKILLNSPISN